MAVAALSPVKILSDLGYEIWEIESDADMRSALIEAITTLSLTNPSDGRIPVLQEAVKTIQRPRFKDRKVSVGKLMNRKASSNQKISPQKLLPAATQEGGEKDQTIITSNLAERLNNISESLRSLSVSFKENLNINKQAAKVDRLNDEEQKKRDREAELEKKKKKGGGGIGKVASAMTRPFMGLFESLKRFFANVAVGSAVLGLIEWLRDQENQGKIDSLVEALQKNSAKILAGIIAIGAIGAIPTLLGIGFLLKWGLKIFLGVLTAIFSVKGLIALGVLGGLWGGWEAWKWLKQAVGGGKAFEEAHKQLGKQIADQEGVLGDIGMSDAGYLYKPDPDNPGKFLKERWVVKNEKGMVIDATVFTKRPDGSYYATEEQREAYFKLKNMKDALEEIKKDMGREIKETKADYWKKIRAGGKGLSGQENRAYWKKAREDWKDKEAEIRLKYANIIQNKFPSVDLSGVISRSNVKKSAPPPPPPSDGGNSIIDLGEGSNDQSSAGTETGNEGVKFSSSSSGTNSYQNIYGVIG